MCLRSTRVTVDGKELGNAPGEFPLRPASTRSPIAAVRYQPFSGELYVVGEGKSQTFTPETGAGGPKSP